MEIINLDMTPSTVTPNAHAGQYDSARTIRFMLKNGGVPFTLAGTETITAEITRLDNTEVTVNVTNTSSNYVDVVFDDTVCTVKGLYACELRLKDSDGFDIGSKNFALLVQRDPYDGTGVHVETVGPADICTFETTLAEPYQSVLVNIEATGGNGTPDSPIPVNGYTEANITRCGVNLYSNIFSEYRKPANYYIKNIPLKIGIAYTLKATLRGTPVSGAYVGIASSGEQYNEFQNMTPAIKTDGTTSNNVFAPTSTWTSPKLIIYCENEAQFNSLFENYEILLVESKATAYTPYTGNTYTIAFGQTVYGGVLDVTRGKLTVTWKEIDFGDLYWNKGGSYNNLFYATPTDEAKRPLSDSVVGSIKSDVFEVKAYTAINVDDSTTSGIAIRAADIVPTIRVKDPNTQSKTADAFKTAYTGHKIIYELATPFDIDLTPEVISAVVGTNNVFADCGETTVKYLKAGA